MGVKYQCKTISSRFPKILEWKENWHYAKGWRRLQTDACRYIDKKYYITLQRWK